ncbi:hypothetical protein ACIPSA_27755 [Streptomyces sp. NPDC086549]|uniref:hypothetical protein n=1 Tax=Streptomyces sp. NPDC086549 TaxID=3365752 RepID=UPI0038056E3E
MRVLPPIGGPVADAPEIASVRRATGVGLEHRSAAGWEADGQTRGLGHAGALVTRDAGIVLGARLRRVSGRVSGL